MGALYLLSQSFDDPQKLNQRAYQLYCDFRPGGGGWGAKADMKLGYILDLAKRNRGIGTQGDESHQTTEAQKSTDEKGTKPFIDTGGGEEGATFEEFEENEGEEGDFTLWDLYDGDT